MGERDYRIVVGGSPSLLEIAVDEWLERGFTPCGGVCAYDNGIRTSLCQAMVRSSALLDAVCTSISDQEHLDKLFASLWGTDEH